MVLNPHTPPVAGRTSPPGLKRSQGPSDEGLSSCLAAQPAGQATATVDRGPCVLQPQALLDSLSLSSSVPVHTHTHVCSHMHIHGQCHLLPGLGLGLHLSVTSLPLHKCRLPGLCRKGPERQAASRGGFAGQAASLRGRGVAGRPTQCHLHAPSSGTCALVKRPRK